MIDRARASALRLLALDVDGVLTDGRLYYGNDGEELKAFNIKDGVGLKLLQQAGVAVAIITGRRSQIVERRATELGIAHVVQGREDKRAALEELCASLDLALSQCAYMGDDLPDLPALRFAGLGITVPNGYWLVQQHADYCTRSQGGQGAVREACDLLLWAQGHLDNTLAPYLDEPA